MRLLFKAFGLMLVISAMAGHAWALDSVPEIDPGMAGSALTLLAGGMLILKDRFRGR
jgi:hypothetical protein